MQPLNRTFKRRTARRDWKSLGMCFLAATTLVVGAFALVYARNQFDSRRSLQGAMYSHYPSDFEP